MADTLGEATPAVYPTAHTRTHTPHPRIKSSPQAERGTTTGEVFLSPASDLRIPGGVAREERRFGAYR